MNEKLSTSTAYNTTTKRMQIIPADYYGAKCIMELRVSVLPKTVMSNKSSKHNSKECLQTRHVKLSVYYGALTKKTLFWRPSHGWGKS
jgi:hypothetical protein